MSPVICVTDFTELTLEAAKTAAAFARRWQEKVILVHSVDERELFPFHLRERLVAGDARRLSEQSRHLRQLGFEFEEIVLRGMPEDGIAPYAWRAGAGLVVIGSAPTATIEHWALGCMAEEVSDTCLVPVLAVRRAAPFETWLAGGAPLNVCVAIDPAARPAALLHRIDELLELGPCRISATFVHYPEGSAEPFSHPHRENDDGFAPLSAPNRDLAASTARELAARNVVLGEPRIRSASAAELIGAASEARADLFMVTSHPQKDLSLLPHRSLCHDIVCHAPMSVLCVPEPAIEPPHHPVGGTREGAQGHTLEGAESPHRSIHSRHAQ
jgi:nucleotide-binding universal stress UspA family protein